MKPEISEIFIRRCFELAKIGTGSVSPNPKVGAVIVYDGKIIGEGWHRQFGTAHAEVNAINNVPITLRHLISHSVLYVNLEPCSHTGKTPPCADLLIKHQIPQVVIAQKDPNPLVSGKGIQRLLDHGIQVTAGLLEAEALALNRHFNYHIIHKKPYVILKWASSKDGFIGKEKEQVWLSNVYSKRLSHQWRNECDAILIGTKTAMLDNPRLDNRLYFGKSPIRIVLDRQQVLDPSLHIFNGSEKTIIVTENKNRPLESDLISYLYLPFDDGLIPALLEALYLINIGVLIVEGGSYTLNEFIKKNAYQEMRVFKTEAILGSGIRVPDVSTEPDSVELLDSDFLEVSYR